MISVLHVGLPLAPPWLTLDDCERISARLSGIQRSMEAAGYRYAVMHVSPIEGLANLRERLRMEPWDAVLIGGGVAADPKLASFKQQIIDAVSDVAPNAKVLEFDHALEVPILVGRAFGTL